MMRGLRAGIALTALVAVIIQYFTFIAGSEIGLLGASIRYFSYFTILTNSLVAIGWGAHALHPQSALGRIFGRDDVRTAVTGYIVLVGVVYHLLLAADHDPQGIQWFANELLHTVVPAIVFLEWLLGSSERTARYVQAFAWQLYPMAYTAYSLIKGAVTGFYPYPFLDVNTLGYGGVAMQLAGMIVAFTLTSLAFIAIGRLQARLMR
jgi:hypothetical protein